MAAHWIRCNSHLPLSIWLLCQSGCAGQAGSDGALESDAMTAGSTEPDPSASSPGSGGEGTPTEIGEVTGGGEDTSKSGSSSTGETTSTDETTSVAGFCGDGIVEGDEACDHGDANSDHAYCTEACAFNVCGDGLLFEGAELCDDGVSNSDAYGSTCSSQCGPAGRCGDGLLQADAGEECDQGPGNGTGEVDDAGLKCSTVCRFVAYRGFVTSAMFTGNLDGLDGADEKCQDAADAAGLVGNFRAFLSGDDESANERFVDRIGDPTPYLLPGGQRFADSYDDLVTLGPGELGIFRDEFGEPIIEALVATNTAPNGEVFDVEKSRASWQSADKNLLAQVGYNALSKMSPDWSDWKEFGGWASFDVRTCDTTYFHLYCLE